MDLLVDMICACVCVIAELIPCLIRFEDCFSGQDLVFYFLYYEREKRIFWYS